MKVTQYPKPNFDKAWSEIERELVNSPVVSPQAGFTNRFQARLHKEKLAKERKQTWIVLTIDAVILIILFVLMGAALSPQIEQINGLLEIWVNFISGAVIWGNALLSAITAIGRTVLSLMPNSWILSFAGIIVLSTMVWGTLMRSYVKN
jgi:hypothetical protein